VDRRASRIPKLGRVPRGRARSFARCGSTWPGWSRISGWPIGANKLGGGSWRRSRCHPGGQSWARHPDPTVQVGCCQVLDHLLDQDALPELVMNLSHPHPEVRPGLFMPWLATPARSAFAVPVRRILYARCFRGSPSSCGRARGRGSAPRRKGVTSQVRAWVGWGANIVGVGKRSRAMTREAELPLDYALMLPPDEQRYAWSPVWVRDPANPNSTVISLPHVLEATGCDDCRADMVVSHVEVLGQRTELAKDLLGQTRRQPDPRRDDLGRCWCSLPGTSARRSPGTASTLTRTWWRWRGRPSPRR
jgi:hypothetical protein